MATRTCSTPPGSPDPSNSATRPTPTRIRPTREYQQQRSRFYLRCQPLSIPTLPTFVFTCPTPSTITIFDNVVKVPPRTMRFSHIGSRNPDAPSEIFSSGNSFQMVGPIASSITAKMVDIEPFRDGTIGSFIGQSVDQMALAFPPDHAIAAFGLSRFPYPASGHDRSLFSVPGSDDANPASRACQYWMSISPPPRVPPAITAFGSSEM